MNKLIISIIIATSALFTAVTISSAGQNNAGHYSKTINGDFPVIFDDLKDTIINEGLVIDFIGNVDTMLDRTSEAAKSVTPNGNKSPYLNAKYVQFCSSELTHNAVSADPQNLTICPYTFFIYELRSNPGTVTLGYRPPAFGPSKRSKKIKVEMLEFLQNIVDKTIAG